MQQDVITPKYTDEQLVQMMQEPATPAPTPPTSPVVEITHNATQVGVLFQDINKVLTLTPAMAREFAQMLNMHARQVEEPGKVKKSKKSYRHH